MPRTLPLSESAASAFGSRAMPVAWDVVTVDFSYADQPISRRRPALVLLTCSVESWVALAWVLMITSARHSRGAGDVALTDLAQAGLPRPCYVRTAKIATVDLRFVEAVGRLSAADCAAVKSELHGLLRPVLAE